MKAFLVTFTQTVRVIGPDVEPRDLPDEIVDAAFIKAQEAMSLNGSGDSYETAVEDTDCPYGTFDTEQVKQNLPK